MKNRTKQLRVQLFPLSIFAVSIFASTGLLAQTSDDGSEFSNELEEVIVTSRKKEETLQDVPFAVAAMTEKSHAGTRYI